MRISTRRMAALALAAITALTLGACGDDAADDEADSTTTTEAAAAGTVEITAVDYGFQGLPDSVEAGTQFTFKNSSTAELHEFLAFRIPDEEKRTVAEIAALPPEEAGKIFGAGPPATALLAAPGGAQVNGLGDGTLAEAGRYAIVCFIPTGADPDLYLKAVADAKGQEPNYEGPGGPPHVTKGMFAEVSVTA